MKSIKPIFYLVLVVAVVTIIIPAILVLPFSKSGPDQAVNEVKRETEPAEQRKMDINKLDESDVEVAVLRSASNQVSKLPLEKYLVGVVAAEMPDSFEIEALKAQALTARTYIINKMMENPNPAELKGADVTDTVEYQVYKSVLLLDQQWLHRKFRSLLGQCFSLFEKRGKPMGQEIAQILRQENNTGCTI